MPRQRIVTAVPASPPGSRAAQTRKKQARRVVGHRERGREHAVHLRVAGITVAVTTAAKGPTLRVDAATERFLVAPSAADAAVAAHWGDPGGRDPGQLAFDSGGVWRLYTDGPRLRFLFSSKGVAPLPYKEATFDPDFTSGEVTLWRGFSRHSNLAWPLEYPLDELLFQGLLSRGRGAEVHACGVVDPSGRGLLFAGQSGAGKTTIARLWQQVEGAEVLSDDRIIVRRAARGFNMHGTPWHGEAELSEHASAPLAGVFFLARGDGKRHDFVTLTASEAAARLLACGFPPFYDSEGLGFTVGFLGEVASAVPCTELRFTPGPAVMQELLAWKPRT